MRIGFIVTLNNKMEEVYLYDVFKVFTDEDGSVVKTVLIGRIKVKESTGLIQTHDFAGEIRKNEKKIFAAFKKNYEEDKKIFFQ